MIAELPQNVLLAFLVFCRVGGSVMLAPGLGSNRVPMRFRLFLAIVVSMSVVPLLAGGLRAGLAGHPEHRASALILTELLTGSVVGLGGRCFVLAAQFAGTFIANVIGLAGVPGLAVDDSEASTPLNSLISLGVTWTMLSAGLHIGILRAIVGSYEELPLGWEWEALWPAGVLTEILASTTLLALQLVSPFIVYSLAVNILIGIIGKFVPQLQVTALFTGAVLLLGFYLLLLLFPFFAGSISGQYETWLEGIGPE